MGKNITEDERQEFRKAMKSAHPIKAKTASAHFTAHDQSVISSSKTSCYTPTELNLTHGAEDKLHFQRSGLQYRLLQKFKRGKIVPQASLDLHRLTISESEDAVLQFLNNALARHYRCVHIVHGKGRMTKDGQLAKLKNWLDHWLRQHPYVLAYTSAQPKDGGTGAIYVLLKRSNNEE